MKNIIFAILAITFFALSTIADTTYICSQIGDWDPWGVPYSKQKELVGKGIVMTILLSSEENVISATQSGQSIGICKPLGGVQFCQWVCTSTEATSNKCPCHYCIDDQQGPIEDLVNSIIDLIIDAY